MRRAELLQGVRKMRFQEAYAGWQASRLTQEEAARLLGVHERTFRRYIDRYEEEGFEGLADKRLEQVSHRRAPTDEVLRLEALYRERYQGWNVKHFHSFYRRRHGGGRAIEVLGVDAVEVAHGAREIGLGRMQQQMVVVAHQAVGVGLHVEALEQLTEQLEEALEVAVVHEDIAAPGTAIHDVIPRSLAFQSQRTRH